MAKIGVRQTDGVRCDSRHSHRGRSIDRAFETRRTSKEASRREITFLSTLTFIQAHTHSGRDRESEDRIPEWKKKNREIKDTETKTETNTEIAHSVDLFSISAIIPKQNYMPTTYFQQKRSMRIAPTHSPHIHRLIHFSYSQCCVFVCVRELFSLVGHP